MAKNWPKTIDITFNGVKFESTTSPNSQKVKGKDTVEWTIAGALLPASAEVVLEFTSSKVVSAWTLLDSQSRFISAVIKNKALKKGDKFPYTVWFVDGHTRYCMEDPELVMDGDTPSIIIAKKLARKKAAKKMEAAKKR